MPKISIIIPAYNIEKYIERCVKSIINQTYKNLEIIIVNDGSTDDTGKIINRLKNFDERIKVVSQENAGLSETRNIGIKKSTGDYIALVDGDDFVDENFIEALINSINEHNADIAICGFQEVSTTSRVPFLPKYRHHSGEDAAKHLLLDQDNYQIVAWNKLYKRELFDGVSYPKGDIHEDNLTTYKLLARASTVSYVHRPLYQYIRRGDSITDRSELLTRLELKERAAFESAEFFEDHVTLNHAADIAILLAKFAYLDASLAKKIGKSHGKKALAWIKSHRKDYYKNPLLSKKLKNYLKLVSTPKSSPYIIYRLLTRIWGKIKV